MPRVSGPMCPLAAPRPTILIATGVFFRNNPSNLGKTGHSGDVAGAVTVGCHSIIIVKQQFLPAYIELIGVFGGYLDLGQYQIAVAGTTARGNHVHIGHHVGSTMVAQAQESYGSVTGADIHVTSAGLYVS